MPCPASPPSTVCQEKVTTRASANRSLWAKAAEVASQIVQALAAGGDPIAIGDTHARRRSIPGENTSLSEIDGLEIDDLAIAAFKMRTSFSLIA